MIPYLSLISNFIVWGGGSLLQLKFLNFHFCKIIIRLKNKVFSPYKVWHCRSACVIITHTCIMLIYKYSYLLFLKQTNARLGKLIGEEYICLGLICGIAWSPNTFSLPRLILFSVQNKHHTTSIIFYGIVHRFLLVKPTFWIAMKI